MTILFVLLLAGYVAAQTTFFDVAGESFIMANPLSLPTSIFSTATSRTTSESPSSSCYEVIKLKIPEEINNRENQFDITIFNQGSCNIPKITITLKNSRGEIVTQENTTTLKKNESKTITLYLKSLDLNTESDLLTINLRTALSEIKRNIKINNDLAEEVKYFQNNRSKTIEITAASQPDFPGREIREKRSASDFAISISVAAMGLIFIIFIIRKVKRRNHH